MKTVEKKFDEFEELVLELDTARILFAEEEEEEEEEEARIVVSIKDITERKRAEEALRESEERYKNLFQNNHAVMLIIDPDNAAILDVNPAACVYYGWSREELLKKKIDEINTLTTEEVYAEMQLARTEKRNHFIFKHRRADGSIRDVDVYSGPLVMAGKDLLYSIVHDITDRKRAEELLRTSEAKYRLVVENANEAIAVAQDGMLKFVNRMAIDLTGYSEQDLTSRPFPEFVHPDDRGMVVEHYLRRLKGDVSQSRYVFRLMVRDGSIKWLEISAVLFDWEGNPATLNFFSDVTERKKAEEEIRRKAKDLQEKNDELTRFTAAVLHDLRSPLITIQTFQGYLEQDIPSQDAARIKKDLGYIRNAADKIGRLIDELLRLSRIGRIINPSEDASLQAIVQEALDLVAGRITKRGVRVDITEEPVLLWGDRTRLVEVFLNLVDNAAKFMGAEPAPRVEIGVEQAGGEMVLYVRDNGIGIDPRVQPILFSLFQKLDPETEGMGIGLALVRRIVELHGGRIWVESEGPGKGATFRFTLAKTRRGVGRTS